VSEIPPVSDPAAPLGRPGLFIALEGGDGAGKSTQAALLSEALTGRGHRVVRTREPGGTPMAEALRTLVLSPEHAPVDARTEALLYATARASHVHDVLLPALQDGAVVICDRFVDSSLAYQGVGRGLGVEQVAAINAFATGGLTPDLTVLLDAPAGLGRARRQGGTPDRLEAEPDAFHEANRTAFLQLAAAQPQRYLVLDASRPAEELGRDVLSAVLERLEERA